MINIIITFSIISLASFFYATNAIAQDNNSFVDINEISQHISFNYTQSDGPVGSIKNISISYDSQKNELTFIDKYRSFNKTISDLEKRNLIKLLEDVDFFNIPSSFPIKEIFTNYSSYNLTVSLDDDNIHSINWIDEEFSPNVPLTLFELANAVENLSSPTLELLTDKNIYNKGENVTFTVKNNGNDTLYFRNMDL